jgi:G:T-mismatch repair DNA endonuclease (very short patch repair protein)
MLVKNQKVNVKWNNANRKHYESFGYVFTKNGEEFEVDVTHLTKSSKVFVKFICDWCNSVFERDYHIGLKSENDFCNHQCYGEFSKFFVELDKPIKICESCGKEYKVEKYRYNKSRYCSDDCRHKGHSLEMQGENHHKFKPRKTVKCNWCNQEFEREVWRVNQNTYNFCNVDCRQQWHKNIYLMQEDVIERNKKLLLSNITDGKISTTKSKPQILLNELLISKKIKFTNEKLLGEFSFDVFLDDFDLLIEVNGGFWHCDNRIYNEINYESQVTRIMMDKKKKTFIKNKYNKNILYLWEYDVENAINTCDRLIDLYIKNNGVIKDYHSFNYEITESDDLCLNDNLIVPYMDWDFDKLKTKIDLTVKEKLRIYNPEKHVIFNCDNCGKETDQILSQYMQSTMHYCSANCRTSAKLIGENPKSFHNYNCDNCDLEMNVPNHIYQNFKKGKRKSLCCSRECSYEYRKKKTKGEVI